MPLKRGRQRTSCEYCHRRKIQCTLPSTYPCSVCATRQQPCRIISGGRSPTSDDVSRQSSRTRTQIRQEPSSNHLVNHTTDTRASHASSSRDGENSGAYTIEEGPFPHTYFNDLDGLSLENLSYLDHVFLGECGFPDWLDDPASSLDVNGPLFQSDAAAAAAAADHDVPAAHYGARTVLPELSLVSISGVQPEILLSACQAYFDIAAPALPVLSAESFWEEYHCASHNQALICAVACRGMPFLAIDHDKHIQLKLAREFRKTVLLRQQAPDSPLNTRIGDLEALILMLGFDCEDTDDRPTANLASLFLTHDALVLMTLQLANDLNKERFPAISHARQRFTLLFWHVYGVDAFHSLDIQRPSRIQDIDTDAVDPFEVQGFLDAILGMARLARTITSSLTRLQSMKTDRARLEMVEEIYQSLVEWNKHALPPFFRWPLIHPSDEVESNTTEMHSLTLALLQLNCYMQIEKWLRPDTLRPDLSIEASMLRHRIALETFRAIHATFNNSAWKHLIARSTQAPATLFSPLARLPMLRDICAGVCFWLTHRQELQGFSQVPDEETAIVPEDTATTDLATVSLIASLQQAVASATLHEPGRKSTMT